MGLFTGQSLRTRLLRFMALGTVLSLVIVGSLGYLAVRETLDRSLEQRKVVAATTAAYLEARLQHSLTLLATFEGPRIELSDGDNTPERAALRDLYFQSVFDDHVFLLDAGGGVILAEPERHRAGDGAYLNLAFARQALAESRLAISGVQYLEPGHQPVVFALSPLRDRAGSIVGWVGGAIDLTGPQLAQVLEPARLGETGHVEVVDSEGVVLASTRPALVLTQSDHERVIADLLAARQSTARTCHTCHEEGGNQRETEVMAFVPLATIPWGISVRQSEAEALGPVRRLTQRFIVAGVLVLVLNLALAWGIGRGVVKPLRALTDSAKRIAQGELQEPIPPLGRDEVGALGASLETMRQRLKASLETIRQWNRVLEARVVERTRRLEEVQDDRARLLERLINAQEEERNRVARELHDEVSQNIAFLALALDQAAEDPTATGDGLGRRLGEMKDLAVRTHAEVRRLILDLRPSVLDDLGLVAALRWYATDRLERQGVRVHWDLPDEERRLPPPLEVTLFRVAQEAISNIARHAAAQNAIITLELRDGNVEMTFEDDGKGFDPDDVTGPRRKAAALGIVGIQERVGVLGGALRLDSHPGGGTVLSVAVPFEQTADSSG